MKYTIAINQKSAIELGIKNINQAAIFDLLIGAAAWASPVIVGNDVYYWVARQSIANELPILGLKPDTIYRHLKALSEIGLINHIKSGKKDLMSITEKGKSYYVGNKSEKEEQLGNKSEKQPNNSDLNPTYHITNTTNHNTKVLKVERFTPPTLDEIKDYLFKKKLTNVDAETFFYHYEQNDWNVGKNKMKSWTAALSGWNARGKNEKSNGISKQGNCSAGDAAAELRRRLGQSDDIFGELRENRAENESVVATYDGTVRR